MTYRAAVRLDPSSEEALGVFLAEETARVAREVGEKVLNPPRCALAQLAGTGSARGALEPSAAKSTLTRDARRKARLQRQEHLEELRRQVFG